MASEIEIRFEDESGEPVALTDARIYRDRSGIVMEDAEGQRTCIVTNRELTDKISQMPADDPPIYIYDVINDQRWRIDIPRIVDVKKSYIQGDITEDEFEQQVEQALEQYGDPERDHV